MYIELKLKKKKNLKEIYIFLPMVQEQCTLKYLKLWKKNSGRICFLKNASYFSLAMVLSMFLTVKNANGVATSKIFLLIKIKFDLKW